jgi:microcystin-dependent protein
MKLRNLSLACALALPLFVADNAAACGTDPYIGQVCYFTYTWGCPQDTLPADGRSLQVSQYQALFSLMGCAFGGNCSSTFNLPDLRGRAVVGTGMGPGLSNVTFAQQRGAEQVALNQNQLPAHTHNVNLAAQPAGSSLSANLAGVPVTASGANLALNASTTGNTTPTPTGASLTATAATTKVYSDAAPSVAMKTGSISGNVSGTLGGTAPVTGNVVTTVAGSSSPVTTLSPELGLQACIVINGLYPMRP